MTTVTLLSGPDGLAGFVCEGHADYAPQDTDIVCAGISALTFTCANALESVAGIAVKVRQRAKDGFLQVLLPENLTQEQLRDSQVLFKCLQQGIGDLAAQYPKHVRLLIQEWRKPL